MPVINGSINLAALTIPNVYVSIIPPNPLLNGVPTDILGIGGIASWGPVNSPVSFATLQQGISTFGYPLNSKYDLMTAVYLAVKNGASNFVGVRVTDGTDDEATTTLIDDQDSPGTGAILDALYTGTVGNTINAVISPGSKNTVPAPGTPNSWKISIYLSSGIPEVFDNISGSGNTLWVNLVAAINNGQSPLRGPSQLVTATVGSSTHTPKQQSYQLSGGSNGNATITTATLIGVDGDINTRTGMYCLRGSQAAVGMLADADDSTHWTDQLNFGLSEGIYMIGTGPAGQNTAIATAIATKQSAGLDSYAFSLLLGDWIQFNDPFNNVDRFVSQQAEKAGELVALSPEQSSLNKPLVGFIGTQQSAAQKSYSDSDLASLYNNGIDVITLGIPASSSAFGVRLGINTSSNSLANTDDYPRLVNFLAQTMVKGLGFFIGLPQNPDIQLQAKNTLQTFFANLVEIQMIQKAIVILDGTNNPSNRVNEGYMQADVTVYRYPIIQKFIINLQVTGVIQVTVLPPQLQR